MTSLHDSFRRIGRRFNAWTDSRLNADERADVQAFDRRFKQEFWRWVTVFMAIALGATLLLKALWPGLGWSTGALFTAIASVWLVFIIVPAWFGYRRFAVNPWKLMAMLVGLALMGGTVGFIAATLESGRGLSDQPFDKVMRAVALAVLVGVSVSITIVVITRVRLREAAQRNALLAAENESERLARQTVQAELKLLQAQVEPHFLFNTLANVRHLVQSGSPDSLRMLDHLILYLRASLPDIRSESSTLGREAEMARAYLEIMKMRMGGQLAFTIDVAPELASHPMPPLMLMTLVENAVKHGIVPTGRGNVRVVASPSGTGVIAEVIDDGVGLGGTLGQGLGLNNVRERLRALYGDRAKLVLESVETGGTVARLEIPA